MKLDYEKIEYTISTHEIDMIYFEEEPFKEKIKDLMSKKEELIAYKTTYVTNYEGILNGEYD